MTHPEKFAAGCIVARRTAGEWRVLLLRAYRNWDFPKGLVEPGETPLAAARRELREETGLDALELPWGEAYVDTERYAGGKVARYYLGLAQEGDVHLPPSAELGRPEHHEFRWAALDEARTLLVPRLQQVLDWAAAQLGEKT